MNNRFRKWVLANIAKEYNAETEISDKLLSYFVKDNFILPLYQPEQTIIVQGNCTDLAQYLFLFNTIRIIWTTNNKEYIILNKPCSNIITNENGIPIIHLYNRHIYVDKNVLYYKEHVFYTWLLKQIKDTACEFDIDISFIDFRKNNNYQAFILKRELSKETNISDIISKNIESIGELINNSLICQ